MDDEKVYVGRQPCGCVTLLCMERFRDAAKEIAKCIQLGETVDRMTLAEKMAIPWKCPEHAKRQPAQAALI